ncbi:MAG: cupin domain-containing protein [Actinobacteria bacterium]|nr:cupin domain-containing protein [Actinomycetota bacterium]
MRRPAADPRSNQHDYAEVFIVLEGESTFIAGDEERPVHAGEIVVVPPNTPHRFFKRRSGSTPGRSTYT